MENLVGSSSPETKPASLEDLSLYEAKQVEYLQLVINDDEGSRDDLVMHWFSLVADQAERNVKRAKTCSLTRLENRHEGRVSLEILKDLAFATSHCEHMAWTAFRDLQSNWTGERGAKLRTRVEALIVDLKANAATVQSIVTGQDTDLRLCGLGHSS